MAKKLLRFMCIRKATPFIALAALRERMLSNLLRRLIILIMRRQSSFIAARVNVSLYSDERDKFAREKRCLYELNRAAAQFYHSY